MHLGDNVTRPSVDDGGGHFDDGYDDGEEWTDPTAFSRGWAFFRLVGLVVFCGLASGAVVGITLWITLTALGSNL